MKLNLRRREEPKTAVERAWLELANNDFTKEKVGTVSEKVPPRINDSG